PYTESAGCACRRQTGCSAWRDGWFREAPIRRAQDDATPRPPASVVQPGTRAASCLIGSERLCLYLALFLDEHLDARLRLFQLLAARVAQLHPFLKEF